MKYKNTILSVSMFGLFFSLHSSDSDYHYAKKQRLNEYALQDQHIALTVEKAIVRNLLLGKETHSEYATTEDAQNEIACFQRAINYNKNILDAFVTGQQPYARTSRFQISSGSIGRPRNATSREISGLFEK